MMTPINLGALRISQEVGDLYDVLRRTTGFITGTVDVDISGLPISAEARFRLAQWSVLFNDAVAEHEEQRRAPKPASAPPQVVVQPEPVAPVVSKPVEPLPEQIDLVAYEREQIQRATDEARGIARLYQFQQEQGLRDCKENADAIRDWLDANCKGYVSQDMIDAAVLNLGKRGTNVLLWDVKSAPVPPPPSEPQEVLGTLPEGTKQLPLDADETIQRHASKAQLYDLIHRRRAATNQQYVRRGFSASF
jgi:hypothetical protein